MPGTNTVGLRDVGLNPAGTTHAKNMYTFVVVWRRADTIMMIQIMYEMRWWKEEVKGIFGIFGNMHNWDLWREIKFYSL